jgi:hypothetical protein
MNRHGKSKLYSITSPARARSVGGTVPGVSTSLR